jgi:nucleoid DNA-binding protein
MPDTNNRIITKDEFIHLLSNRANFTLGDTRILWATVEDIFQEAIESRVVLDLKEFGQLYYATIPERDLKNPKTLEIKHYPETQKLVFRLSSRYRNILKKKHIPWKENHQIKE